jgi:phosphatidylglycerophosphate synthase
MRASQIPNVISALRILLAPALWLLASAGHRPAFAWLVAIALVSDIADGTIARAFGFTSKLGAVLDSIADLLLFVAAFRGFWIFFPDIVAVHGRIILVVLAVWVGTSVLGLFRYRRLASFHTWLTRICSYALGTFLVVVFFVGFVPWLFWTAITLVLVSQAEECAMLLLLPEWTPDCRGLYWHLRSRRRPG